MLFNLLSSTYLHHAFIEHTHTHQIYIETTSNVETHKAKTTKALFICHEKYICTFHFIFFMKYLYLLFERNPNTYSDSLNSSRIAFGFFRLFVYNFMVRIQTV